MDLFKSFRRKDESAATPIYVFTFKIESGQTQIPAPMIGAYVLAYTTSETPTKAAERAWNELRQMGYVVVDMNPSGGQFALAEWDRHISERWPEFPDHFPKQQEVLEILAAQNAIFSPFAGFEAQH